MARPRKLPAKPRPLEKSVQADCINMLKARGWMQPEEIVKTAERLSIDPLRFREKYEIRIFYRFGTFKPKKRNDLRSEGFYFTFQSRGVTDLWIEGLGYVEIKRDERAKKDTSPEQQFMIDAGLAYLVGSANELRELMSAKGLFG